MAQLTTIRTAIKDALAGIPGFTVYEWTPDSVNIPCAFVQPSSPVIEYQTRFGSGKATYKFVITVLAGRIQEEAGQDEIDQYISPDGPIISAIQANTGYLGAGNFATVINADRYGSFRVGDTNYMGVQLRVEVTA